MTHSNINPIHLEPLALNRVAWQVTCHLMTKQIHYTNQQREDWKTFPMTPEGCQHYPNILVPLHHLWTSGPNICLHRYMRWHQHQWGSTIFTLLLALFGSH